RLKYAGMYAIIFYYTRQKQSPAAYSAAGAPASKGISIHSGGWIFSSRTNKTMQEDLSVAT
ncbi:MAG: hypothetical protein IKP09_06845, partial [Lentisphaeria bacterium]|nr:hypothetical protein [Lentisphaeria bacterium]